MAAALIVELMGFHGDLLVQGAPALGPRGDAISLLVPAETIELSHRRASLAMHGAIWLLGLLGVAVASRLFAASGSRLRRRETELAESRRFLGVAQRMGSIGHYVLDVEAGLWAGSDTLCRVLGLEPKAAYRVVDWLGTVHPEEREELYRYLLRDVLAARGFFHREYRVVLPSTGEVRWVSGFGELTLDDQGRPVTLEGTIQDVTERKRAEIAQRETEERFRRVIDNIPDIIYRAHGGPVPGFDYVSPAAEAVTGYPVEEHYTNADLIEQIVHPDDRESWMAIVRGQRESDTPMLVRFIRKDGETIWLEHRWSPVLDALGRKVAVDGVARDVTDRVRAEEERDDLAAQLAQSQKLESIGRLAGGVAHDFNNMLSVIMGQTELGLAENDEGARRRNLESVLGAARRSADLTRQLLAFARQQSICPCAVELNERLEGMLSLLHRLIGENISLEWQAGALEHRVFLDPTQVDQVVANLVVNARDAIDGAGRIRLSTRETVLDADFCATRPGIAPGRYVELRVEDTGSGMDQATRARIFEPFFTTKEFGQGSGLGLATVYGVMQQNGGTIDVRSAPGEGTEFILHFPALEAAALPASEPAALEALGGVPISEGTVLIVEDDAGILEVVAEVLRREGFTPLTASTPTAALDLAETYRAPIHLLVTDVVMPEMDGLALAERVVSLRGDLPVLYMSGYAENMLGGARKAGHHLDKPFSRTQLIEGVRRALRGRDSAPASALAQR